MILDDNDNVGKDDNGLESCMNKSDGIELKMLILSQNHNVFMLEEWVCNKFLFSLNLVCVLYKSVKSKFKSFNNNITVFSSSIMYSLYSEVTIS